MQTNSECFPHQYKGSTTFFTMDKRIVENFKCTQTSCTTRRRHSVVDRLSQLTFELKSFFRAITSYVPYGFKNIGFGTLARKIVIETLCTTCCCTRGTTPRVNFVRHDVYIPVVCTRLWNNLWRILDSIMSDFRDVQHGRVWNQIHYFVQPSV